MIVSIFKVNALHQYAVNVTVPTLHLTTNAGQSTKETTNVQRFQTVSSQNNINGETEIVEIRTYNSHSGKYSSYVNAVKNCTTTIPDDGENRIIDVSYILNARNTKTIIATVNLAGVWIID